MRKVPELVWNDNQDLNGQRAENYYICLNPGHETKPLRLTFFGEFVGCFANLEIARATANAHNKERVDYGHTR
jgi:hypothetical protein